MPTSYSINSKKYKEGLDSPDRQAGCCDFKKASPNTSVEIHLESHGKPWYNLRQRRLQFLHFLRPHHKSHLKRFPGKNAHQMMIHQARFYLKRNKFAAFDFDSTLIQTSSGKKHSNSSQDWKWWHASVPGTLRKLYLEDGFRVVVISNQAGISLKTDPKPPKFD
ncbi:hypothetical protein EYC84_005765 [Monilinia fructicola]|uniref:Uncharacterized protein n=1 Tax=Monilinia fructicola TaxID=38448 RepID=A0A5M9JXL0_MONFR|nr:hypothetical protein EYC84_005765 [Monilinia fructicola]